MKKKMAYTEPIPPEVLRDPVALRAFLKDLFRKGYNSILIPPIPAEIQRDPVTLRAFLKPFFGNREPKISMVFRCVIPRGGGVYGTILQQTPWEEIIKLPLSYGGLNFRKEAIAGHKQSAKGKQNARKRWDRDKQKREQLSSELRQWYKRHRIENPSHKYGQIVSVAMDRFHLSRNTIKKYTATLKF